jgi:hypothetical protein
MIVTRAVPTASMVSPTGERIRWRSLARRGMLHSECDAVDYLALDVGTEFALRGLDSSEGAWLVLSGGGVVRYVSAPVARWALLRPGDLVLAAISADVALRAGANGLGLLWLDLTPAAVSDALPARRPVV